MKRLDDGLEKAKQVAISRNGKCKSKVYKNYNSPMVWACEKKHKWSASYKSVVIQESWCPYCYGRKSELDDGFLEEARNIAQSKDGELLSSEYTNIRDLLEWKCKEGHTWKASLTSVNNMNSWCPYCSGRKSSHPEGFFGEAKELATARDGELLSDEYVNARTKLLWKCCKCSNEWEALFSNIKNKNSWCPICAKGNRDTKKINNTKNTKKTINIKSNNGSKNRMTADDIYKLIDD